MDKIMSWKWPDEQYFELLGDANQGDIIYVKFWDVFTEEVYGEIVVKKEDSITIQSRRNGLFKLVRDGGKTKFIDLGSPKRIIEDPDIYRAEVTPYEHISESWSIWEIIYNDEERKTMVESNSREEAKEIFNSRTDGASIDKIEQMERN